MARAEGEKARVDEAQLVGRRLRHHVVDYAVQGELASALIGELQGAYVRLPQRRREALHGLITAYYEAAASPRLFVAVGLPGWQSVPCSSAPRRWTRWCGWDMPRGRGAS